MLLESDIWISSPAKLSTKERQGLLLDRDGVVAKEVRYLSRAEDVELESGIEDLLSWAKSRKMPVAVATNQAGIARGFYGWTEFEAVENEISRQLARTHNAIDITVACPFHPDFTAGYGERHAYWRKPGPGLLNLAIERLALDASTSWMIGDKAADIAAAKLAGLQHAIHVLNGHGRTERAAARELATTAFRVMEAADNMEALAILKETAHFP
jgi:D-glycero-D-manno-heptose 1,7-bisphosphate phosphatase